ncbi:hypothetical protein G6F43_002927 [Rhizopus delemar]|nr:hypothetical protein G6F43_002927 [Rhizopus delemar]
MTPFTSNFPLELFDKICFYLTKKQKAICQSVCQDWKVLFAASQYRHVQIIGQRQFQSFFPSLFTCGHYIKTLSIQDVCISSNQFNSLPTLSPFLYSLRLIHVQPTEPINDQVFKEWKYLRCLDQDIIHQITSYPTLLSHLSIHLNPSQPVHPTLHPNLNQLVIRSGIISVHQLDLIHQACPTLQELCLIDVCLEPCSEHETTAAVHLQILKIENAEGLNAEWLEYVAFKYPNLREICLWKHIDQPTLSPDSLQKHWRAVAELGHRCHQLKSIHLLNLPVNQSFFQALDSAGTELEKIGLGDMTEHTSDALRALVRSRQQVTHLTLWGWPSLCIPGMMEHMVRLVGCCSHRLISFEFSMQFSGIRNSPFPLTALLASSSTLKQLDLGCIQTVSLPTYQHRTLNKLVLRDSCFRNQLFQDLTHLAPNLSHLQLDSCTLIDQAHQEIKIHLPHHSLQSLHISSIRPPSNHYHMKVMREVKFFHVLTHKQDIYELMDYEGHRPTRYARLEPDLVTGPCASIQCAVLGELLIAGFLIN